MPFYDYTCGQCGNFRLLRPMARRNRRAVCPECDRAASRLLLAPNLAVMHPNARKAATINEKSRHEPRVSTGHSCGSGCGCGTPVRKKRMKQTKLGTLQTSKASARPWMLGH